jgi:hypothetical protein
MPVIHVDAQVSPEQLLKAVEQMPSTELDAFVTQIMALQARRGASNLTPREPELMLRIHQALPMELQRRFDELVEKRQSGEISESELGELIAITDRSEEMEADRIHALADMAELRNTTVPALMHVLEIRKANGQSKN